MAESNAVKLQSNKYAFTPISLAWVYRVPRIFLKVMDYSVAPSNAVAWNLMLKNLLIIFVNSHWLKMNHLLIHVTINN